MILTKGNFHHFHQLSFVIFLLFYSLQALNDWIYLPAITGLKLIRGSFVMPPCHPSLA
jgi:hypothetical protein